MLRKKEKWSYGVSTHKGSVRENNEDNAYLNSKKDRKGNHLLVAVVADGMGGYHAGDVASSIIVAKIDEWYRKKASIFLPLPYPLAKIEQEMEQLLKEANQTLLEEGERQGKRMGSTASILFLYNDRYLIIHIGDSRIYQITRLEEMDYSINQLTEDHSWVMDQVRKNLLTVEEAEQHPKKNVLMQCLGVNEQLSLFVTEGKYDENDLFFLCSDGFYNIYPNEALLSNLNKCEQEKQPFQEFADYLVEDADDRGATDNITVSLVALK
ncbi:Serine/threonine protein phosphatase PrpC [Gracilibacillus orientalis]|uniref:Serine/threonine protein phosphatase PrpC n=1 Tax=Gracilibacillus orientalis TaxID=334253 RepID=A0A1I4P526_9BACI|nr:protein phosphatase 2C domain-containing protein [Gracilibacillus orientalis]SFM22745.1 Serine/threonine protein phosphatase PrpC [Gracilibacillus orientalis]